MSAEANRAIADFLVAEFEYEAQTTAKVLAAVPAEGNGYQPDAKSKPALGLVRHIAIEDQWMLNSVIGGAMAPPADGAAFYGAQIPAALGKVKAMSDENLAKVIDFSGVMQVPAVNLLSMALKHSVHHRGQLSSYLRAAGGDLRAFGGFAVVLEYTVPVRHARMWRSACLITGHDQKTEIRRVSPLFEEDRSKDREAS